MATSTSAPTNKEATIEIARLNAINSPLLRLPTELRLQIFEYALQCSGPWYSFYKANIRSPLQITHVSREVFRETADLFYSTNTFMMDLTDTVDFIRTLPEVNRKKLRHIRLIDESLGCGTCTLGRVLRSSGPIASIEDGRVRTLGLGWQTMARRSGTHGYDDRRYTRRDIVSTNVLDLVHLVPHIKFELA